MEPNLRNPFAPPPDPAPAEPLASVVNLHGDPQPAPPSTAQVATVKAPRHPGVLARAAKGWAASASSTANNLFADGGDNVLHDRLPSIAQLWQEMREARWAPADAGFLKGAGRVYRFLIAIPISVIVYPLVYVAHRPLRLFIAVAVSAIAYVCIVVFGG